MCLNIIFTAIALLFALFYTNILTILSFVGAVTGFALIYVLPILVHMKKMKLSITNQLLTEAILRKKFEISEVSGKELSIKDGFMLEN